jgi:carbon storage regulator
MLILSRKVDEVINIGDKITVKVLAMKDGHVRLGIEAPRDLPIYRAEVYAEIQEQNKKAVVTDRKSALKTANLLRTKSDGSK